MSRVRIRPAFDQKSVHSKQSESSQNPKMKQQSHSPQLSQRSLGKIHTFALKKQQEKSEEEMKAEQEKKEEKIRNKAKMYYVEEHVKVLSEIIAQAEPILNELAS